MLLAVHRLQYQMAAMKCGQKARTAKNNFKHLQRNSNTNLSSSTRSFETSFSGNEHDILGDSHSLIHIPLFAPLTPKQLKLVYNAMEEREYVPGQKLIGAFDASPGLFIVISGEVALRMPKVL